MKKLRFCLLPFAFCLLWAGCASLDPGANALVVRTEQTQAVAYSAFDAVLKIDDSNRSFFRTNAPALHQFCEWLREPQIVSSTNSLPRGAYLLFALDNTKLAYKQSLVSSNNLVSALAAVESAVAQSEQYMSTYNPH